jgi:hypothetical protein
MVAAEHSTIIISTGGVMPTPEQILLDLAKTTHAWQWLAIVWHIYFAGIAIALVSGIRPSKRIMGVLLALPLLSVGVLAWTVANPFNGILFLIAATALALLAARLPNEPVELGQPWLIAPGVGMFVFGWIYPHFLDTSSFLPYLYAAPTGLIPCPTLSIVIGMALILGGLRSRIWSLLLATMGIFYGIFGVMRLGVMIDLVLLFGALLLVWIAFRESRGSAHGHLDGRGGSGLRLRSPRRLDTDPIPGRTSESTVQPNCIQPTDI